MTKKKRGSKDFHNEALFATLKLFNNFFITLVIKLLLITNLITFDGRIMGKKFGTSNKMSVELCSNWIFGFFIYIHMIFINKSIYRALKIILQIL